MWQPANRQDRAVRSLAVHRRGEQRQWAHLRSARGHGQPVAGPALARFVVRDGGWDLDSLDAAALASLVAGLANEFALEDYPELRAFTG